MDANQHVTPCEVQQRLFWVKTNIKAVVVLSFQEEKVKLLGFGVRPSLSGLVTGLQVKYVGGTFVLVVDSWRLATPILREGGLAANTKLLVGGR